MKSCPVPGNPANGQWDGNNLEVGNSVMYRCETGYEINSGDQNRTCQDNETWTGTVPTCASMYIRLNKILCVCVGGGGGIKEITPYPHLFGHDTQLPFDILCGWLSYCQLQRQKFCTGFHDSSDLLWIVFILKSVSQCSLRSIKLEQ